MTAIPKTMRAAAIDRSGKPEVLMTHTLPVPAIDDDEVLISVDTAGVGSWDADMRGGWSPDGKPHFPMVLGTDGSGTIAALGKKVKGFKEGEKVYAYSFANPKGGFYAEYVAVSASNVAHVPRPLDLLHAGAAPTTGLTALQGIDDALQLKRGESVIIHGGSGGVGTLAIQFAKLRGARVFATASGQDGVMLVRALGADEGVDGHHGDCAKALKHFAPDGVDALLALAGGEALDKCVHAVRRGGRSAYPHGVEPAPKAQPGVEVRAYDGEPGPEQFERLNQAVIAAKLEVPIAAAYPLELARTAHERIEAGHVLAKIVLRVKAVSV